MSKYKQKDDLPPDTDSMTDAEFNGYLEGAIQESEMKYVNAVIARGDRKLRLANSAATGEHVPGRYTTKSAWSPAFGGVYSGENDLLTGVKALGDSDSLERKGRQLHDTYKVSGENLDSLLTTEQWYGLAMIAQSPKHQGHAAAQQKLQAYEAINKASLAGDSNQGGGYSVPDVVSSETLKLIRDASQVFGIARHIPMTSDVLNVPDEATQVTTYWSTVQASILTAGEPVFGVKSLAAAKLFGRATFSLELIDDSAIAVLPFLNSCFAEKMGGDLDFQAVEGVGSPFTGIGYASSVVDAAATNGTNGVVLQYGLGTTTIGGLVKVFTKGGEGLSRRNGVWISGPGVYAKVLAMVDSQGQPIVRLGNVEGSPGETPANTLFGRPYIVTNRLQPSTIGAGTASVGNLYFGSPSALVFGVRQNMRFDVTEAVNWDRYSADCRLVGRYAYQVGIAAAWTKQMGVLV